MKRLLEALPAVAFVVILFCLSVWSRRIERRKRRGTFRYRGEDVPKW